MTLTTQEAESWARALQEKCMDRANFNDTMLADADQDELEAAFVALIGCPISDDDRHLGRIWSRIAAASNVRAIFRELKRRGYGN